MNRRLLVLALVAVVALGGIWFLFLRSDNPDPVSLEDAVAAATDTTSTTAATAESLPEAPDDGTPPDTADQPSVGVDGTWTVLTGSNSFVGYRVGEELAGIGVTEAVGRTSNVSGSLELEGSSLTAVDIEVDMTTLRSDDNRRDGAMSRQALETSAFPTARFVLTEAVDFGSVPEEGVPVAVSAVGDLTLHGVTRSVNFPLEAQLVGEQIVVVGSLEVVYGDFDIALPSAPILVSVEDNGLIELQLTFARG